MRVSVEGHHSRRCGLRWLLPVLLPFKFGYALASRQKCQGDHFGIVRAESQRLRSTEFAAHRSINDRADRLCLPWLHVGLDTSTKASAQVYLFCRSALGMLTHCRPLTCYDQSNGVVIDSTG